MIDIKFLRENKLGRATFFPLNIIKPKGIEEYVLNKIKVDGFIGIASDLVKYDKKYQGIILSLLGRTVIVEDMDQAISLAKQNKYSFKIVTLKGDIINPSGMISEEQHLRKQ